MNISNQLSLEQEFELVLYKQKIEQLDLQQSRKLLSETLKTMLLKDNIIKYVIKNSHFRQ
nr:phycobilisome degradation protein [Neoporphyra perforata]AGQ17165.1 phycobilisome degradation protein [Neoporphyra perforata]AHB35144.1 phycobilisome degradation protein [Neoporphyra perforata]AHB35352.1 phycobilisome degradation protein [Neoporphyra perforata]AIA19515.1 phycobilisome degradation protein [Neoporphyra perforata]AIA19933.1 phycobilisome degradation protein [Neoporphyra perforata]